MINSLKTLWKRATTWKIGHPSDPNKMLFESKGGGWGSIFGSVDSYSVMGNPTVYACVRINAQSVAQLPLRLYKTTKDGKNPAVDHPVYRLMSLSFNKYMTSFMAREYMQTCLELKGNAYAHIVWDKVSGYPASLHPIDPSRVRIKIENGEKYFRVVMNDGSEKTFLKEQILHISNVSLDGIYGASVLALHRATFNKAQMQSDYSNAFFDNAARPSGAFSTPGELSEESFERLKKELREEWQGALNAGKPMLLEHDLKFVPISMNAEDMAYIDQMKFSELQICQIFAVPPHMVGILDRATFSNIEEQNTDFYRRTLMALFTRWEMELNTTLLLPSEQKKFYFKFDPRAFLRGNTKARYDVYAIARNWGIMSLNEIRELEDLNLLDPEIGDVHLEPLNMKKAGEDPLEAQGPDQKDGKPADSPKGPNRGNTKKESAKKRHEPTLIKEGFADIFEDLIGRALSKHTLNLEKRFPKIKYDHQWRADYSGFFHEERDKTVELLSSAIAGYCRIAGVENPDAIRDEFIEGYLTRSVQELDSTEFSRAQVTLLMDEWMKTRAVNETKELFAILERD